MAQPVPIRCRVQFGPFTADLRTGELLKHGIHLRLQDRPFAILAMLLEQPGKVVTREEMKARLWPDGTFVDFDNNISSAIGKLRAALGDSAAEPRYIETVGRGYRFTAEVSLVAAPAEPVTEFAETADKRSARQASYRPPAASGWWSRKWLQIGGIAALLAIAGGVAIFQWSRSRTTSPSAPRRMMLAVLPFANLTGDPGQEYFSDGLTEEMITQLGSLDARQLGVIARTSVMRYKNSHASLPQIGAELGIDYLLEGSVRREGGRVRITAQLINVRDQTHVWAREYDREPKDLLAVQTEIAQEIGDEIKLSLGEDQVKRPAAPPSMSPQQVEAYDLYLKGQYFFAKRQPPDLQKAVDLFEQATAIDPNYAPAWATLADCYALLPDYEAVPQSEFIGKARAAALRALKLDDKLPEAHTALGLIVQNYDWDWQAAEKEFRRAIQLNPNYVTAHHWYAEHLMWRGRFQEAFDENAKAQQLDPLSLIVAADRGVIYHYTHQYDAAIRQFRRVLDLDPDFPRAHMIRFAYVEKGMFPEALASVARVRALSQPWAWADLAYIEGRAGNLTEARRAVGELQRMSREKQVDQALFVRAYVGVGDNQQALASLEKAYAEHSDVLTGLKVDPIYDPLRGDVRFQRVLQQVGLAQP